MKKNSEMVFFGFYTEGSHFLFFVNNNDGIIADGAKKLWIFVFEALQFLQNFCTTQTFVDKHVKKVFIDASPRVNVHIVRKREGFEPRRRVNVEVQTRFIGKKSNVQLAQIMAHNAVQLNGKKGDIHEP
jgi:hypothetical protein